MATKKKINRRSSSGKMGHENNRWHRNRCSTLRRSDGLRWY